MLAGPALAQRATPEIHLDASSKTVTVKLAVEDQDGHSIPNLRRDDFAAFENGVRQKNVTVDMEHAPVSIAIVTEWGGRYAVMRRAVADEAQRAVRQLIEEAGPRDKVSVFRYGDKLEKVADFTAAHEPEFSDVNLYDALIATEAAMKKVEGRKAIVLVSSGIDTFSKASFEDALAAARNGGTPILCDRYRSRIA